jgi:gliding motility-associated-like protein
MINFTRLSIRTNFIALAACIMIFNSYDSQAQIPNCSVNVPTYNLSFVGNPGGTWTSPSISRQGNCCGTSSPDRCIHFAITIDTNTVAVNFQIASGAIPPGALFYQIDCGPPTQVGNDICISGAGLHHITFCKPGNNVNTYRIQSIARPLFPFDDTLRVGCSQNISVLGLVENTVTFNSIFPGAPGTYNSYLSCATGCSSPVFTPQTGAPAYVEYQICGFPQASGCGFAVTVCDTVRMYVYPELIATVSPNPASFCPSSPGVNLVSTVTGGFGTYTYEWKNSGGSTIATTPDYFATAADNYTLNVSDGLVPGCPVEVTPVPVVVANVVLSTSQTNVACSGDSSGSAVVSATGGTLPYTYSWNTTPVQTNDTAVNLPAGSYTVTVTDAGGCAQNSIVNISQPAAIVFSLDSSFNVTCNGNSNGSIYISASGGTGPLTYSWSPGGYTTQDVTGLSPATYTVTISDSNGCVETIVDTITEPSTVTPLPGLPVSSTDALCFGDSTGTASVNIILLGGTPPYSYDWSTGDTTSSLSGLPAGNITLQITDANGCTADTTLTIGEPTPLSSSFPNFSSYFCGYGVSCNGASDGSIDYDVIGGTPTYTFSWNAGAFVTEDLSGIPAGFYTVDVTDANGCMITDTITITQPDLLVADVWSPVNAGGYNIACHGDSSGVIHTILTGGCSPMTFDWTTPLGLPPDSGLQYLPVGFYSMTVTDANGCAAVDTITLTEPDTLVPRITSIDLNGVNISCFGGNDGTAYLESISGGSSPFTYYWSTGDSTDTLNNIISGNYILNVIDVNGCTNHASINLTQPDILNSQYTTSHYPSLSDPIQYEISCNGLSDGFIVIDTVVGGVGPFSYAWDVLPDITPTVSGLQAGTYSYTITDANNCELTVAVELFEPDPIDVTVDIPLYNGYEIDCNGNSSGAINLTVLGGTVNIDYTYAWTPNTSDVTPSVSNLTAGVYCAHIQDDNGCAVDTCFTLTEPTPLVIDSIRSPEYPGGWNVSCNGGDNGNIYSWSSGGVIPYSYYWSNGDSTANTLNVSVFTYYLTVTDPNGCIATDSITIDEPALVATTIDVQVNVGCFGDTSGSITVSSVGGTPSYTYSTDGITFTSSTTLTGFTSGSYVLYTADTNGCMDSIAFTITEPSAPLASQVDTITNVDCFGNATGAVTVSGIDGTPPYEYSINNVDYYTTGDFDSLTVGSYGVTVRDSNGCTTIQYFNITQPAGALAVAVASQTNVDCFGNSSGQIIASGSLGTAPYQYSIDGLTFSPDSVFTGLIAANYTITIQDTNGCQSTVNVSISEPVAPLTATSSTTMALCTGSPDGTATVNPTGGTPGYTYQWNTVPVQNTQTATGLIAGTYSVLITDTNGCTYNDTGIVVTEATVLAGSTSSTMALCNGDSTGTSTVTPAGGTAPYTYSWNTVPVQTSQTATGLPAGNYIVTITDTNGCNVPVNATVTEPLQLTATVTSTDVLCNGDTSGTATAIPSGGTPGYTYSWNTIPVQTTPSVTGLALGSYTVIITDTNSCVDSFSVVVNEPAALATTTSQINVNCFGDSTGMASVNVSGGIAPYTYSWNSNPVQTTDTAFNLMAGTYTVTVTDSNNCITTSTVTITEPLSPLTALSFTTDVLCNGGNTGTATVSPAGGTPGYTYLWNTVPVQTTSTASGLIAGNYSCVITDTNNCTITVNVTVNEAAALTATSTTTDVLCNGNATGSATVNPTGGVPGYSYSWNTVPVQTTQTATGLLAGSYTCTITDTNSCTYQVNVTINEPTALTNAVSVSTFGSYNIQCAAGLNGYIVLNESGGTPNYTYLWTGTTATGDSAGGLSAGPYSVIITDVNMCTDTVNVTLTEPTALTAATSFTDVNCNGDSTGSATAAASGGVAPYAYSWNTNPVQNTATATGLPAGSYTCTITDSNNCIYNATVVISQPAALSVNVTGTNILTCNQGNDGMAVANVSGGTTAYTYSWSPIAGTNDTLSNLAAGTYTVTVTDANGCTGTDSLTIIDPAALTTAAVGPSDVCGSSAGLTGTLQLNQTGLWTSSDPGVTFDNSTSSIVQANNLQYGATTTFTWTVTNSLTLCTASATVQVHADEPVTAEIQPEDTVFCLNAPDYDGHFHLNATQPVAGSGTWSVISGSGTIDNPSALNAHYEIAVAGSSVVMWTVVNGVCSASDTITFALNNDGPCLELELPTGITPNSDTYNDDYDIHGIENYPQNTFIVFNRWGNEVYKKENYRNHDWKGDNTNGKPLPDGTYYVILLIHDDNKTTRNTYVDIRR